MAAKSLADRVAALEEQVGSKTIQEQFREQAELIDLRFTDEFRQQAELIDSRLTSEFRQQAELIDRLFAYRFEELDKKWGPRFANLEKDMAIVREGIGILLKRRPK